MNQIWNLIFTLKNFIMINFTWKKYIQFAKLEYYVRLCPPPPVNFSLKLLVQEITLYKNHSFKCIYVSILSNFPGEKYLNLWWIGKIVLQNLESLFFKNSLVKGFWFVLPTNTWLCLSVCLSACYFVCLPICLSLSLYPCVCTFVCLSICSSICQSV